MKIYVDVIFILNFFIDLIILLSINILLKRKTSNLRLFLGALIGELSTISLFLPLSSLSLFLVKLLTSIFMNIIAFKYYNFEYFKKNFLYFYFFSTLLGGIVYLFKLSFNILRDNSYQNIFLLLIIGPYFLYSYIKEIKKYILTRELIHKIDIYINSNKYSYIAYIDTGNKLKDPYKKRPIILVYDKKLNFTYENSILVPFQTLNNEGIIKCQKVDKIIIDDDKEITNILIGQAKEKFNIDEVEAILPNIIKEEL